MITAMTQYKLRFTKTLFAVGSTLFFGGCATAPQWLADHYNAQDPCQSKGVANYNYPSYCGAGTQGTRIYIVDDMGRKQVEIEPKNVQIQKD
jgi:hypothetical protein